MRFPGNTRGVKEWLQGDFFKLGNVILGPARLQLILVALLPYLFGNKDGPQRHVLTHEPFNRLPATRVLFDVTFARCVHLRLRIPVTPARQLPSYEHM